MKLVAIMATTSSTLAFLLLGGGGASSSSSSSLLTCVLLRSGMLGVMAFSRAPSLQQQHRRTMALLSSASHHRAFLSSSTGSAAGGGGGSSSSSSSNSHRRNDSIVGGGITSRLRRHRSRPDNASLKKRASILPGYVDGALLRMSTTEDQTATTTLRSEDSILVGMTSSSISEEEEDNKEEKKKKNTVLFPNAGKNVLDLPPRMRFAPSPTGSLHVGGARTALYNWLVAKKGQMDYGKDTESAFVLRVEDTDVARSTKESENSVIADLTWLGLHWDEGPDMPLAKYGPYRQSERDALYSKIAQTLIEEGKAYPCFCTPDELEEMKARMEAQGIPPRYDGTWRDADPKVVAEKIYSGTPYTVRFKVPPGARVVIDDAVRGLVSWDAEATVGDFILLRSSGIPVYNFCVAVDDACMGITTVIRAEEHLTNTLRQGLILDALGAPRPRYAHCSLILGEDKQKLSKRHGATSCNQFRLDGFLPDAMINYLALLGWNDGTDNEIFTREELIEAFDINRIVKSPSVFDMDKLKWVNSQHLKKMRVEDILPLVEEQLRMKDMILEADTTTTTTTTTTTNTGSDDDVYETKVRDFVFASTALAKQMMETLQDAATNAREVLGYNLPTSYEDLIDGSEAQEMIQQGNFYGISMKLLDMYESKTFPLPDNNNLLAAFIDETNGKAIVEDTQVGGAEDASSFPQQYKSTMKHLAKEMNVKGKNLFHPIRLALTGEMSGQDVTKQLSLLAMAVQNGSVVNVDAAGVVPFESRMERLKIFCDSIPQEYRNSKERNSSTHDVVNGDPSSSSSSSSATAAATTTTTTMTSSSSSSTTSPSIIDDPFLSYTGPPITALDIRVGRILKVWTHEEADKLYCEEIDVGEDQPRKIASGLRPYMSASDLEGRMVLVLCNLKERKLAGFPSHGMVLCASNADHSVVKLVSVPVEAKVGERITVPGLPTSSSSSSSSSTENSGGGDDAPYAENKIGKQKVFEKIAPYLKTSEYGVPEFCGRPLMTSAGVCTSPIANGSVS